MAPPTVWNGELRDKFVLEKRLEKGRKKRVQKERPKEGRGLSLVKRLRMYPQEEVELSVVKLPMGIHYCIGPLLLLGEVIGVGQVRLNGCIGAGHPSR